MTEMLGSAAEAASQSKAELMINTTVTGLVVVFSVLIILVFAIMAFSKITLALSKRAEKKGKEKNNTVKTEAVKKAAPVVKAAASVGSSNGISGEIIAVIAAAVASMDSSLTIKSVKRLSPKTVNKSGRRKAWNQAGILENTRPF